MGLGRLGGRGAEECRCCRKQFTGRVDGDTNRRTDRHTRTRKLTGQNCTSDLVQLTFRRKLPRPFLCCCFHWLT